MKQEASRQLGLFYCHKHFNRLNVPGGYVTPRDSVFHLYVADYQGNNVAVINTKTGQTEQLTDYYPYGQPINNGLGASVNPYKYGGKELLTANGYNASDFAARWLSHSLPCFQSPDPLAHETPWLSMYMYCGGDPINLIDPTGMKAYFMHGTGDWDAATYFNSTFQSSWCSVAGEFESIQWSGSLYSQDTPVKPGRIAEGHRIGAKIMKDIRSKYITDGYYTGGKLVIGGHSHGANVGIIAAKDVYDGLSAMVKSGELKEMPTINLVLLNTPTILNENEYRLSENQKRDINSIQISSNFDLVSAGGRAVTSFNVLEIALQLSLNGLAPVVAKMCGATLSNVFYKDVTTKIRYNDQYNFKKEGMSGLANHMGIWRKNVLVWFGLVKNNIK